MNFSGWQKQKIETLAEYQDMLAYLYTLYSKKFPADKHFWLKLAVPKVRYADWLRSCIGKIAEGSFHYNMMRFTIETVLTGLDFLQELIRNARSIRFTREEAVVLALGIESGFIASKFYEIVEQSTDELIRVIGQFKAEKMDGMKKLRNFITPEMESRMHQNH